MFKYKISIVFLLVFFVNRLSAQVPAVYPKTNLVAFYKFNNNVNDSSGNSRNATSSNVTYVTSYTPSANKAGSFSIINKSYVRTPNAPKIPDEITYSFRFKTGYSGTKSQHFVGYRNSFNSGGNWDRAVWMDPSGTVSFYVYPGSQQVITSTSNYNDNKWHHLVATLSSTRGMELYVDCKKVASSGTKSAQSFSGFWVLGFDGHSLGSGHYEGSMDDFAIWDRSLSTVEINSLLSQSLISNRISKINGVSVIKSCGVDSLTLNAVSNMKSYFWSNGSTKSSTVINKSGTHNLKVTDSNNCVFYDTFYISLLNPKISPRDTVVCSNDSILLTIKNNLDFSNSTTNWSTAIKKNLIAYYPFNANANDVSGNNHNGKIVGTLTSTTDRFNNSNSAYKFGSGYIQVPTLDTLKYKPITYSAWVVINSYFSSSAGHKFQSIVGRNTSGNTQCGVIGLYADKNYQNSAIDNQFSYWIGAPAQINSKSKPATQKWVHVVFTHSPNGDWKWYLDGKLINTGTATNTLNLFQYFWIGACQNTSGSYNWQDKIDDVAIWNRVLDSNEVKSFYSNQSGTSGIKWFNGSSSNSLKFKTSGKAKVYVSLTNSYATCSDSTTISFQTGSNKKLQIGTSDTIGICGQDSAKITATTGFKSYSWDGYSSLSNTVIVKRSGKLMLRKLEIL